MCASSSHSHLCISVSPQALAKAKSDLDRHLSDSQGLDRDIKSRTEQVRKVRRFIVYSESITLKAFRKNEQYFWKTGVPP